MPLMQQKNQVRRSVLQSSEKKKVSLLNDIGSEEYRSTFSDGKKFNIFKGKLRASEIISSQAVGSKIDRRENSRYENLLSGKGM